MQPSWQFQGGATHHDLVSFITTPDSSQYLIDLIEKILYPLAMKKPLMTFLGVAICLTSNRAYSGPIDGYYLGLTDPKMTLFIQGRAASISYQLEPGSIGPIQHKPAPNCNVLEGWEFEYLPNSLISAKTISAEMNEHCPERLPPLIGGKFIVQYSTSKFSFKNLTRERLALKILTIQPESGAPSKAPINLLFFSHPIQD